MLIKYPPTRLYLPASLQLGAAVGDSIVDRGLLMEAACDASVLKYLDVLLVTLSSYDKMR